MSNHQSQRMTSSAHVPDFRSVLVNTLEAYFLLRNVNKSLPSFKTNHKVENHIKASWTEEPVGLGDLSIVRINNETFQLISNE